MGLSGDLAPLSKGTSMILHLPPSPEVDVRASIFFLALVASIYYTYD
jgi:hypothetical protein